MKLASLAFAGLAAAALAGTAIAANPKSHQMDVPLADGSVVHVEYYGDVAPRVTLAGPRTAGLDTRWAPMFPSFAGFDRMFAEMQRQSQDMARQAQQMARQDPGAAPYVASFGNLPAGQSSTTIVSVSNGGTTCTRTTEVVSQGAGKAPKVTSNASGDCGGNTAPAAPGRPLDRT